jgi:hypothetical protein
LLISKHVCPKKRYPTKNCGIKSLIRPEMCDRCNSFY